MDLHALAAELQADDVFADEMYCALCNTTWRHASGATWHGSWRIAADVIATVRGRGERYIDFYYSATHAEGTISARVAAAMAKLGWTGQGQGSQAVYSLDSSASEQTVWVSGDWMNVDDARRQHPELFAGDVTDDPQNS